jgi:RNA:NAD 2'-phosphotransferase (TPT1/KptA family)
MAGCSEEGILFYKEENGVWLASPIPAKYLIIDGIS